MIMHVDLQSETPIYLQIVNQIIEGIASGALKQGESLPSIRSLAGDIGINMHTVNKAYTFLKQEGFIQIHRHKGVIVQTPLAAHQEEEYMHNLKESLRPIIAGAICRKLTSEQMNEAIKEVYRDITKGENPQ
jgi:GntR family transcriptional regulator